MAAISANGRSTGTPTSTTASTSSEPPMASALNSPPTVYPSVICQGRIGAESTSLM